MFDYVSKNTDKFLLLARGQMSVFPVADAKKSVIYNTIEYEVDTPVYGLKTAPYKLINISNYIPQKGLAELLDALKLLPQTQFSLDAYGNISDPDFYNSIIAKAKQTSNVQIHEAINGAVKFEKLKQAQLFICPSHNEGFPLVLLEAMSVGLPIVTTKVGFIEEMLGSDYPLYCEPNNATSLAQAINQFFELENKQELSERIKHLYHAKFSRLVHKQVLNQIFDIEN
ncbi:glycosyltransferase family 4 protein [Mucilaginibacter sp. 21P]|uniref:glycosyltransferase n=1 Tax=Mucilaginibacter sp. 21P TaxID=2778902 RepID=UPI001C591AFC|nr:glycosyltransferase [Mucilaginibacter sp. 21P]QXV67023.1 glycosyltransferase family 4 protein [Mucilaginibacter sp. 21P]